MWFIELIPIAKRIKDPFKDRNLYCRHTVFTAVSIISDQRRYRGMLN